MAISPGGRPADDNSLDRSPRKNWVEKVGGLPRYVRMVANALVRKGMPKERAIPTAINTMRKWAAGGDNVSPKVQAAAAAALAEWEGKKAATVSLSARVDVSELLDLAMPAATLEWALEALEVDELDLAEPVMLDLAREYVRDLVGRFATSGKRDSGRTLEAEVDGDRKPKRDLPRNPAAYDVDTLADVRRLVRSWADVPMTARPLLKSRLTAAAGRLGAEPRLKALVAGLGDGDGQREKGEGSAAAVRRGDAREWLRARGVKLSDDDMTVLLDLASSLLESDTIDLAEPDVLDLAPGDYKPPYDWKHGFIPLTPAAALSKAKKPPYAGKGAKRGKAARAAALTPIRNRKPAGTQSVSKASMDDLVTMARTLPEGPARTAVDAELRKRDVSPATVREGAAAKAALEKAKDDAARGRGVPGAVEKAEKAARRAESPRKVAETGQTGQNGAMTNPTRKTSDTPAAGKLDTSSLPGNPVAVRNADGSHTVTWGDGRRENIGAQFPHLVFYSRGGWNNKTKVSDLPVLSKHKTPDAARKYGQKYAADNGATREYVDTTAAAPATPKEDPTSSEAKRNPGPRNLTAAEKRAHREKRDQQMRDTAAMSFPEYKAQHDRLVAEGKAGPVSDDELRRHHQQVKAEVEQKAQEGAAGKPRAKTAGGGSYPTKADGSPDYGAMSAEQAATIRANEAGRGVGARVSTDRGPGTVKSVSSRGTTIDPDNGDPFHVAAGTFGHDRIRPLGKGGDNAVGSTSSNPTDKALRENARNRDDLMSLRWTRDSGRGGVSVSYSPADADKLERLERDGLIRMDRRGLSAQADDQYVLTDKGKARVSDVDLHQNTQDRARRQLAERDQQAGQRTREQLAERIDRKASGRAQERHAAGQPIAEGTRVVGQNPGGLKTTDGVFRGYDENGWHRIEHTTGNGRRVTGTFNPEGTTTRDGKSLAEKPTGDATKPQTREQLREGAARSANPTVGQTTPQDRERAEALRAFPDGTRVAYNGRESDGTGVVVGRREDRDGTILEVRDDKDNKTYEWTPEQVKPRGSTAPAAPQAPARPSSTSTNPDAPIRIEHGPDGTLVHGTTREDAAAIKAVGGFKWSRNLNAWYLPRTWGESTRSRRVDQLAEKLGDKAGVDRTTGPRKSAAERDAETRERAAGRAERMEARAERQSAEADRRFEASDLREEKSGIPFGQPILVGHHSERRHRRAIERAQANLGKGVEAQREAERASEAAERARRTASGTESKTTTGNRIKKLEAEQRDIARKLAGTSSQMSGPATGAYAERLRNRAAEVDDELEFNRGKLEAAGGVPSQDSVSPGDFIKVAGTWYPVQKSNAKSATVPSPMGTGTRTAAWHKVQEVRKADEVTREEVARMVADVQRPFPNLADALRKAAPPAGRSAGSSDSGQTTTPAATPGGITADTAARMSDEQLERAMSRLMADNNYDGPAFKIIEAELNRRDAARAEGNRPRR